MLFEDEIVWFSNDEDSDIFDNDRKFVVILPEIFKRLLFIGE
jgi:hypothetical protein